MDYTSLSFPRYIGVDGKKNRLSLRIGMKGWCSIKMYQLK